jgi:hypothetical protein
MTARTAIMIARCGVAFAAIATVFVFYVYGFSQPALKCQARGGTLAVDFTCNKITIVPLDK